MSWRTAHDSGDGAWPATTQRHESAGGHPTTPAIAPSPMNPILKLLPATWRAAFTELARLGRVTRGQVLLIGVLVVFTVVFESVGVAMILPLLDFVQSDGDVPALVEKSRLWRMLAGGFDSLSMPINLVTLSLLIVVLILLRQVAQYVTTIIFSSLRLRVEKNLRDRLFAAALSARASVVQNIGAGSFVELVYGQCARAASLVEMFAKLWGVFVIFAAYGAVMFANAPVPSLLAIVCIAGALASVNQYVRITRHLSEDLVAAQKQFTRRLSERYRAWRLIKLADSAAREQAASAEQTENLYTLALGIVRAGAKIRLVLTPLITFLVLATLYVSVEHLSITVSVLTLFVVVILRLMPVVLGFARIRLGIEERAANLRRVASAEAEVSQASEPDSGTRVFRGLNRDITFEDVHFSYPDAGRSALAHLSVTILARSMTAIVGPSGAGKSTLVDLLPRLITPDSGAIRFDGIPAEAFTLSSLRRAIAYMPQEPVIFDDTVIENVRYLMPEATPEQVVEVCERAHADEFIREMPDGYDTRLGEGGIRLSAGQRQRIALARALLSRANILLLDEPTGALDYESEQKVKEALDEIVARGRMTVIIIAHRLSTIRNADHLIVLKEGRLVQAGAPADLSRDDSYYRAMLDLGSERPAERPVPARSGR